MEVTVAGLTADITKLVAGVATAAGSNHDYSQTGDFLAKRGLEASQLRSQREHPHSCSAEPAVRGRGRAWSD